MRKLTAIFIAVLLSLGFATPAESDSTKWTAYQKTLATYSGSNTALSSLQKSQIRATLDKAPLAEKFICTGIRYYDQPMSVNIMVRKRAKEACAYAKELKPELSTWYQNKPTKARSYAGKVLLTVKSPAASTTVSTFRQDAEICKIEENSLYRNGPLAPRNGAYNGNATAFPFNPTTLPVEGELNVEFIYVDWEDLPGTQADYDHYEKQITLFEQFYWMASENKLKMNVNLSDDWFRAKGSYKEVATDWAGEAQRGSGFEKQKFYDVVVDASDPYVDFSDVDIVFFAVPRAETVFEGGGPHEFNFDYNAWLKTDEGNIYDTATAGDFFKMFDSQSEWVYYVHEVGHMIGIPHQANEDENKPGVPLEVVQPLGGWDIMSNQGGFSKTITSWLRWLAGWLEDSQVVCLDRESISKTLSYELTPVNEINGETESVVVKISDSLVIVVESRREDKAFDDPSDESRDGLIVYAVSGNKGSAQGNQQIISPRDITNYLDVRGDFIANELDAILFQGDSVDVEGIRITNIRSSANADLVQIEKIADGAGQTAFSSSIPAVLSRLGGTRTGCSCCGCSIIPE